MLVVLVPFAAAAQTTVSGGDTAPSATTSATAAPTASASATGGGGVTGYGYSDHPAPQRAAPHHLTVRSGTPHHTTVSHADGPVATLPGFEMLGDGGSRLFVELTQSVTVEERHTRGTLTYVLKGAHVTVHNNVNPLVTVHFNTPVSQARLVPSGHDLLFVIALRAAATPTWKLNPAKEGSAVLDIDFPKGSYLPRQ